MSTMTLEQVRDAIRARPYVEDSIMLAWADAIDAHLAQPAQAVDVGRWYVCVSCRLMVNLPKETPRLAQCQCSPGGWSLLPAKLPKGYQLIRALSGEKAGPVDGEVLVAIERGEGYEDVHPDLVAEDCMGNATERGWRWRVVSASPAPDKEGQS